MRKLLLATAAVVGASVGTMGLAAAQAPVNTLQGTIATPASGSFASVYGDNNYMSGNMQKGPVANPTPGTMVIRLGVRFDTEVSGNWSNLDTYSGAGSIASGNSVSGARKLSPVQLEEYVRIYPGMDAMAANGLRYGAAAELRQSWAAAPQSETSSSGASGYSSTQSVYVRRAFAYLASDQWGIVRLGEMDGVIGTFDEGGATTGVFLAPDGPLQGSDLQVAATQNSVFTGYFGAQSGNEYANSKLVYLSPSFYGFDVGLQYAPNGFNGFTNGNSCLSAASTACANLASDSAAGSGSLLQNQYAAGIRYQGNVGPAALLAYYVYMGSGHTNYTGTAATAQAAAGVGSTISATNPVYNPNYTGQFDNLSINMVGANVKMAGVALFGNVMWGAYNGVLGTKPAGAPDAIGWGAGAKYTFGPYTIGAVYSQYDSQGAYQLTGISQRHEYIIDTAASYTAAPGLVFFAEYYYTGRHQGDFNFNTNQVGTAYNDTRAQAVMVGSEITW